MRLRLLFAGATASLIALSAVQPANAFPVASAGQAKLYAADSNVVPVQYYGSGRHYRGYRGGYGYRRGGGYGGAAVGAGIAGLAAGALIGGAIAAQQPAYGYAPAPVYAPGAVSADETEAYCASRYKSYDPQSGTFLGYDGARHSCP